MGHSILIAGIGNIFQGDDAFGVTVAQRLLASPVPGNVRVMDVGIRSIDLGFALLDKYDLIILVDATCRGCETGHSLRNRNRTGGHPGYLRRRIAGKLSCSRSGARIVTREEHGRAPRAYHPHRM